MPKGPNGEKRPADAIGCAVQVARIATGEDKDAAYSTPNRVKSGRAGGKARSEILDATERSEIARKASKKRWNKKEATMNAHINACDAVAARYAEKQANGLVDVKFLFQNREEATTEMACEELEALHQAIEDGKSEPLDFGDLSWKD